MINFAFLGSYLAAMLFLRSQVMTDQQQNFTESKRSCPNQPMGIHLVPRDHDVDVFYLDATNGDDAFSGKWEISDNGTGPFKTLSGAMLGIQRARRLTKRARLFVKQGVYHVNKRINLKEKDSNLEIIGVRNSKGNRPLISGAVKISGRDFFPFSQTNRHTIYAAHFNGTCSSHVFIGSKRLVRARKPNLDRWTGADLTGWGPYLYMRDLLKPTKKCNIRGSGGYTQRHCPSENRWGFKFSEGDINPNWYRLTEAEILVFNAWTAERRVISHVDMEENSVHFQKKLRFPVGKHPNPSGFRFVVENIFEELDTVGEFYCDSDSQRFYLIPPDGALEQEDVYVAQSPVFILGRNVENLSFQDLSFKHSHDNHFSGYNGRPGLIQLENCDGIQFKRCEFANIGYTGIFTNMVKNMGVTDCTFSDVGNIALTVEYNSDPTDEYAPRNIMVKQNTFVGCGVYSMYQPTCIHVKGVQNIVVSKNNVGMSSYAGIRVGWQKVFTKDYVTPGQYVFYVTENNVHHYGNGILNDFGGIYLSSNMQDCGIAQNMSICHIHALISNNTIHNSESYYYGAIGVYTDTAASSVSVTRNWIYKLADCAVNFHCGQNNIAVNNMIYHISPKRVFGVCNPSVGDDGRMPRQTMTFQHNVIYITNTAARLYGRGDFWVNSVPKVDWNNYYFKPSSYQQFTAFFSKTMAPSEWVENAGNDGNSVVADPLFKDLLKDDYRLTETSPGFKQNIESVDLRYVLSDSGAC
nr:uncharacterized protein LOC100180729 [Ciona intestinalis]|eukprot:XP_002119336.3 uncharacterized protein LOC100180729 [Ciona intestinalis]